MARNRKLADALKATTTPQAGGTQVAARGSDLIPSPKKGYQFVQKSGPRAGQHFNIVKGDSGLSIRKYEPINGSVDTAIAKTDQGVDIAAQRRDVAAAQGRTPQALNSAQLARRLKNRKRRNYDIAV
jgi:hypothetical protein